MTVRKYSRDEVCDRGAAIYAAQIKARVEPQENGKFIVIDIASGDYEIAEDMLDAEDRLLARRPAAIGFGGRVGYESAYKRGGGGARFDHH